MRIIKQEYYPWYFTIIKITRRNNYNYQVKNEFKTKTSHFNKTELLNPKGSNDIKKTVFSHNVG